MLGSNASLPLLCVDLLATRELVEIPALSCMAAACSFGQSGPRPIWPYNSRHIIGTQDNDEPTSGEPGARLRSGCVIVRVGASCRSAG